jgi:hypothetical protein
MYAVVKFCYVCVFVLLVSASYAVASAAAAAAGVAAESSGVLMISNIGGLPG